jgi:two-component system chemotaxis sensor kinase CheA
MREMLRATQSKQPTDMQRTSDVQFDVEMMIAQKNNAPATAPAAAAANTGKTSAATAPAKSAPAAATERPARESPAGTTERPAEAPPARYWQINFRPYPELFARGNDPMRMLRELAEFGELQVNADLDSLPSFADLDPQSCYLAWNLRLSGDVGEDSIKQVFEWAEGDCDLTMKLVDGAAESVSPNETASDAEATEEAEEAAPIVAAAPVAAAPGPPLRKKAM